MDADSEMDAFVVWFQSTGGFVDMSVMGITEFPDSGRGAVALRDIPADHTLFNLPRSMTLSTRTSPLPSLFGLDLWQDYKLHKGWSGLILCMMWEDACAYEGNVDLHRPFDWSPYMRTLPATFDTPMFWCQEELEELKGTAVIEKLGRENAERAYYESIIPAIKTSPSLFLPSHHDKWYTLEAYHRAGSRILSRSFTVSRWTGGGDAGERNSEDPEDGEEDADKNDAEVHHRPPDLSLGSAMDVDDPVPQTDTSQEDKHDDSDSDSDSDLSDVAMVPMADLLNARWGSENAKLFYQPEILRMATTKAIRKGEQIFNTYGDPPNSDLLRRYGHIDLVPLHAESQEVNTSITTADFLVRELGNPSDIVEIRADLVVEVVGERQASRTAVKQSGAEMDARERIEWWLDEGGDDTFVLPYQTAPLYQLPSELTTLSRLLLLPHAEFETARTKGRLPKGKPDSVVLSVLEEVLRRRMQMYTGGNIEDEALLTSDSSLSQNKRHAIVVRIGEKRILRSAQEAVASLKDSLGQGNEKARTKYKVKETWKEGGSKVSMTGTKRGSAGTGTDIGSKKMRR